MPDRLERRLRWFFAAVAAGSAILVAAVISGAGERLSPLVLDGPAGTGVALLAALGVLMGTVALVVARAPRRETFWMPVLAAAFVAAGLASLAGWSGSTDPGGRLPALAGAVEILLAAALLGAWMRLWFAEVPGELRHRRDDQLWNALLDTLVPGYDPRKGSADAAPSSSQDEATPEWIGGAALRAAVASRRIEKVSALRLRLELRALDRISRVLGGARFVEASRFQRSRVLDRLSGSRWRSLRRTTLAWRDAAIDAHYSDERTLAAIGFDPLHLERRLGRGPNREFHRRRREAAAASAAQKETAAPESTTAERLATQTGAATATGEGSVAQGSERGLAATAGPGRREGPTSL